MMSSPTQRPTNVRWSKLATVICLAYGSREALIKSILSFPRRREPRRIRALDSRLRGNDELISISLAAMAMAKDEETLAQVVVTDQRGAPIECIAKIVPTSMWHSGTRRWALYFPCR